MRLELFGKRIEQPALFTLPAVGFHQNRLVLGMDLPFPVHALEIFIAIDVGRRGQFLHAVPAAFLAHAEMLDVDAAFCQPEIGRIDSAPGLLELVLVAGLIFVGDAVSEQPVGDQQFFEAVHCLALRPRRDHDAWRVPPRSPS